MSFEDKLNQTATYWAPSGTDEYSQNTFSEPVIIPVRWEDIAQLVRSKTGQEYTTKSRVFMGQDFSLDGWLFLGISDSVIPTTVVGAAEIQQRSVVPDLRGLKTLYVAYL